MVRRITFCALVLVALTTIAFAAACGDDAATTKRTVETPVAAVLAASIDYLDRAGLHDIDNSINANATVPANARTVALHAQDVVVLTKWPTEVQDQATRLAAIFGDLATALDSDKPDTKAAGNAAKKAHEAEHDFSRAVWEYLSKQANTGASTSGTTK